MVAFVQRPAPAFKAEVVTKSTFSEVSLSDFRGKWWVPGASTSGLGSYSTFQGCPSVLPHVSESRKRLWTSRVLMNLLKGTLHLSARRKCCCGFVDQGRDIWNMKSEILAFNDALPQFEALNTSVFGNPFALGFFDYTNKSNTRHFDWL